MKIYFDHSATTPMDKKVLESMLPYFVNKFGNPSSLHDFGQQAIAGVDKSRQVIADFLNCDSNELVFTSGATESDNLAIFGTYKAAREKKDKLHIITSEIEHSAVLEPIKELEKSGVKVTYLPTKKNGIVDISKLKNSIQDNTFLVSIMYVNSEVGSIQPIREIGKIIKKVNEDRLKSWQKQGAKLGQQKPLATIFHTDATQAVNFLNCDTKYLHVDLMSISGHKIYGPKGVGALFVDTKVLIKGVQLGGHHENNLRSGTLNVPSLVGLGQAIALVEEGKETNNKQIKIIRDKLVKEILKNIPDTFLNTDIDNATPAHAHFTFGGVEGEAILISLDLAGIAVSTGSACASGDLKPSHVLVAMGITPELSHNSIRFTLGKNNTIKDVDAVAKILPNIIKKLRKIAPSDL